MKTLLTFIFTVAIAGSLHAKNHYGPAGCGLGTMVIKDPNSLVMHVLQATLNGSSGNQTFGMTSGTSNCDITADAKMASTVFIQANEVALKNDIARGEGETLVGLNRIFGCSQHQAIGKRLKKSYGEIFSTKEADRISQKIHHLINENQLCS